MGKAGTTCERKKVVRVLLSSVFVVLMAFFYFGGVVHTFGLRSFSSLKIRAGGPYWHGACSPRFSPSMHAVLTGFFLLPAW